MFVDGGLDVSKDVRLSASVVPDVDVLVMQDNAGNSRRAEGGCGFDDCGSCANSIGNPSFDGG